MKFQSAIITQASGSVGGATFSRNKGGGYIRAKVTGTNPQSDAQTAQRSMFATISAAWRDLTDAQRTAWGAAATYFAYTDALGQTKLYSGAQLFSKLNGGIRSANPAATLLDEPPASVSIPTVTNSTFALQVDGTDVVIGGTFSPVNVPTGFVAKVYGTAGLSAGITNPASSAYKLINTIAAAAAFDTAEIGWSDVTGTPAVGSKVFISIDLISTTSGQMQEVFNASSIITAV